MAKKSKKESLKFYQKLILNRYMLSEFGVDNFEDLKSTLKSSIFEELLNDGNSEYFKQITALCQKKTSISNEQLQQYDLNIVSHLNKINSKRSIKVRLKYFQYLSLLFVEFYLDMYFNHRDYLLEELNKFRESFANNYEEIRDIPGYTLSDLNKIALWNATGSGKTLLMHINYHQYLYYAKEIKDGDSFILLTPKEGLSKQHLQDFEESNIDAEVYDKKSSRYFKFDRNIVQVIENTKLGNKNGDKTVDVATFGSSNVVFVDEGHRGASGDTWYKFRNELCKDGFSFEYSATFGQAVSASKDKSLEIEYEKCIIFDYSYKHFYSDGYGKDYNIINLHNDNNLDVRNLYLTACLMTFYQQKKIYIDKKEELKDFNIENPLMVFIGSSVNAVRKENGRETSDVIDILHFFNDFIRNKNESINNIKRVIEHNTGILDIMNRDVFRNSFVYLVSLNMNPNAIFEDILKVVFNCNSTSSILHIENMKGIDGEISLRLGENSPFGVINVGDDNELTKLCKSNNFLTNDVSFKESLFDNITKSDSKINILIGSKKFTEGWNCWRVSTMGLMNVGRSEGSEIIQLFGRGVRLKGYNYSLMRSSEYAKYYRANIQTNSYISALETLNVFGVKADYMNRFKEYLEEEGVPTSKDTPYIITMPVIRNRKYKDKKLYSLQVKSGLDYKKDAPKLILEYNPNIKIEIDCYGKVQFQTSRVRLASDERKAECKLNLNHLALININNIYLELERYKAEKLRYNLIITKKGIQSLIDNNDWYTLKIPKIELDITSFTDYAKYEKLLITMLKLYCDKLFNNSRVAWENNYMEYKVVDDEYENFIKNDEYVVSINDVEENREIIKFIENLKNEVSEAKQKNQLIDYSSSKRNGNFELFSFTSSLYNPLLYVQRREKEIAISPVALVESEYRFITDLDKYLRENTPKFSNKEIYLIRNKAKKGVGFFENVGFYPDFIMWIIDGDKQYITFIEPHGMLHDTINSEKVQLHKKIKEIQNNLKTINVLLNSVIITESYINSLIDNHPEKEWNDNNVFFMNSNKSYLESLFDSIN